MSRRDRLETAARAALLSFCALSSLYSLLCGVEFAWNNFIAARHYPVWFAVFLKAHAALAAAAAALGAAALEGRARRAWLALAAPACVVCLRPGLAALSFGRAAVLWSFLAWLPYAAWEILSFFGRPALDWDRLAGRESAVPAGLLAGLTTGLSFAAGRGAFAGAWSLLLHGAAGAGLGLAFDAARPLSTLGSRPARAQTLLLFLGGAAAVAAVLDLTILTPISVPGLRAAAYSLCAAGALALAWFSQAALAHRARPAHGPQSFVASPAGLLGLAPASFAGRLAALGALLVLPRVACRGLSGFDWNGMVATLVAAGFWALSAAFWLRWLEKSRGPAAPGPWWPAPAAALALCLAAQSTLARVAPAARLSGFDLRARAEALAAADPSLLLLRRLGAAAATKDDLYTYLQRSTNIARGVPIAPKNLELGAPPAGRLAKLPNIFVFVVDSLRRDYVGAYNPAVDFTPSIDALAKDGLAFRNAFTAYGATGLSEPSIWSGARLPHKQYVTPFSPMNALEKLVVSERYRRYVTMDAIMAALLDPATPNERLDEHTVGNYRFCETVAELQTKLSARAKDAPIFVYSQPQDIHISSIQGEGARPLDARPYRDFYAPYASRLSRLDACLGRFVGYLKREGLYDDSVIVLAADHGDSLGEDGRWGHAYTLFPEILRVPLIVRVPERLKRGLSWDVDAPAFLIDVAPTLYTLLSRPPKVSGGILGRSLLAADAKALQGSVPGTSLEASSYGPVWGLLLDSGRRLYIADAVNYQTYLFDLKTDPTGRRNLSDASVEAERNPQLRAAVEELNSFYGFHP